MAALVNRLGWGATVDPLLVQKCLFYAPERVKEHRVNDIKAFNDLHRQGTLLA